MAFICRSLLLADLRFALFSGNAFCHWFYYANREPDVSVFQIGQGLFFPWFLCNSRFACPPLDNVVYHYNIKDYCKELLTLKNVHFVKLSKYGTDFTIAFLSSRLSKSIYGTSNSESR
jgi:hypothetical protein